METTSDKPSNDKLSATVTKDPEANSQLNEDERKFLQLVHNGCNLGMKFRFFYLLFPLSLAVLYPVFLVHSSVSRLRFFFPNRTSESHFHGVDTEFWEEEYPLSNHLCLMLYVLYMFKLYPCDLPFSCSLIAKYGWNVILFAVLYPLYVTIFSLIMSITEPQLEPWEPFRGTPSISYRLSLLMTYALLLTFVQETVPKKNRGFATSIFCASDALVNCASYFAVRQFFTFDKFDRTRMSLSVELTPLYEICLLFPLLAVLYNFSWKMEYDPVYNFANNWNVMIGGKKANQLGSMAWWVYRESASFMFYWKVNVDNMRSKVYSELEEDRCILPKQCSDHQCKAEPHLFSQILAVQLACCILQLPIQILLRNMNTVFELFGYSQNHAQNLTDVLYIVYATTSLLAIGIADYFPKRKVVLLSVFLSLVSISIPFLQYQSSSGVLYPGTLLSTMTIFLMINSVFLVPTTWTIIGNITGKHRYPFLLTVILLHMAIVDSSQRTLLKLSETALFSLFGVLYITAILTFHILYEKIQDSMNPREQDEEVFSDFNMNSF